MNKLTLLFTLFSFISFSQAKESPEAKGMRIAKEVEVKSNGFIGETTTMKMVLIDAYGAKTTRIMEGKVLEVKGDGDKSLSIFLNPKDVKGTKMLTHTHKSKDDSQWLYLPSLRRVKRISSSNKSSSFMGSEFSYEDLGSQELEKYNYKWLKDAKMGKKKKAIWVLERKPKIKSGYSKQIIYMSKKIHSPLKIEYFDRKSELLKTAVFTGYKTYKVKGKKIHRAGQIHMKNVQTKKESIFSWSSRKIGIKLPARMFKKTGLK